MLPGRGGDVEAVPLPLRKGDGLGSLVTGVDKGPVRGLLNNIRFSPLLITRCLNMVRVLNANDDEDGSIDDRDYRH